MERESHHCIDEAGCLITSSRRWNIGLSIESRFDLSARDPAGEGERKTERMNFVSKGEPNGKELTLDLLDTSADSLKSNTGVSSENEIGLKDGGRSKSVACVERERREGRAHLSERTETDPEERIDSIGDNFSTSDGEHSKNDDGSSSLRLGDVLVGVWERGKKVKFKLRREPSFESPRNSL